MAALRISNQHCPYDFCVYVPILRLSTLFRCLFRVSTFNQEKDIVGAFSVIVKTVCGTDGALHSPVHCLC